MSVYRYKIQLAYVDGKSSETTKIDVASIKSFCIERDYDNKNMPIAFMELTLDKNLVDTIIINAKESKFILIMANYPENGDGVAKACISGEFAYFLQDDVNYNKDIDYSEYEKEANNGTERKDKYRTIMIGLMMQANLDNNKRQINTITYNTTIMDIVASITNHMVMLIEPFKYNKKMEQLIIPPLETVSKALEYLNRMSAFYDTKFRYFLDYDTGYLLSCSGKPVKKRTEKFSTVLIDIRNVTSTGAFEQGMREDRTQNCYVIPISTTDTVYQTNLATNQDFNNITAILDSSREMTESDNSIMGTINKFKAAANKIKTASKNIKKKFNNLGNDLNNMKDQMLADMNKTLNVSVEVNGVAVSIDNIFSKPGISVDVKNKYIQNIITTAKEVEDLYNEVKDLPNTYEEIRDSIYENACNACGFDNYINGVAPANYSDNVGGMNNLYDGIIKTSGENTTVINKTFSPALDKINSLNSKIDSLIKDINALPTNIKSATSSGDDSSSEYIDVSEAKALIPTLVGLKPDVADCVTNMNNTFGFISEIPTACVGAANSCNSGIQDILATPNILQNEFNGAFSGMISNNTLASTIVSSAGMASAVSTEGIANISLNGFNDIGMSMINNITNIGKSFMSDIELAVDGMNDIADIGKTGVSCFNTDVLLADAADYALKKTKLLRVPNDNVNLVKQIISEVQLSSARLTVNKNGLDTLVISPNKEYIVKNFDTHSNRNGKFLLANKKEVYVREDDSFIMNTILTFRQIPYAEKDIWSSIGTQAALYGLSKILK